MDDNYEVIEYTPCDEWPGYKDAEVLFVGGIADCEAFLRLTKEGLL